MHKTFWEELESLLRMPSSSYHIQTREPTFRKLRKEKEKWKENSGQIVDRRDVSILALYWSWVSMLSYKGFLTSFREVGYVFT